MNQSDRLKAFKDEHQALIHDFELDLIEPATYEILANRLSEKYIQLARAEEVEK